MLQGAWTAEAARRLSNEFDAEGFDVFCPHCDKRTGRSLDSHVKTGRIISWVGNELKRWSQFAWPDIAVVDRNTKKVLLLSEVEEGKPQPKVVIGDIVATLLGDHITFAPKSQDELTVGPWTTFSFFAKSTGKGSGEQQLRMLEQKVNEARMNFSTPNSTVKEIIIDSYQSESELHEKLMSQTRKALMDLRKL